MSWTDERVEALKGMWNEGKSASQIAKALGGVTRNAVIGKVHRLGLSNRTGARGAVKDGVASEAEDAVDAVAAAPEAEAEADLAPEPAPAPRAAPAAAQPAPAAPRAAPAAAAPAPTPEPAETSHDSGVAPPTLIPVSSAAGTHLSGDVPEEARRSLAAVEKKARRLNLQQLTERTCKWPIGDPATEDFYFCGLQSQPGKPYCEAHVVVAFQPMSARRDRSRSR
ncbi:MAG: GcrA cell cycle regulator [Paracoccaceae bacterium]|jgi:GcrA cell cycle regulator